MSIDWRIKVAPERKSEGAIMSGIKNNGSMQIFIRFGRPGKKFFNDEKSSVSRRGRTRDALVQRPKLTEFDSCARTFFFVIGKLFAR